MSRSAVRRDVIAYLSVLMAAAVGVAVILPHSSAAPVILGFVPATVVAVFALIHGRSAFTGLGLGRPGFAYWPIAIALPGVVTAVAVTATAVVVYLVARRGVWRPEANQTAREMIEVR